MDSVTVRNLELLENTRAVLGNKVKGGCLLDFLDNTVTKPGGRKMRSNIVSPSCDLQTIQGNQEVVTELIEKESLLADIREELRKLHDTDQLVTHYSVIPRKYTMVTLKREAENAIRMKEVLGILPGLTKLLKKGVTTNLGKTLVQTLERNLPTFNTLHQAISKMINEETAFPKAVEDRLVEAVFCITKGLDELLDVARATYAKIVSQIRHYVVQLNEQLEEEDLQADLAYSTKRGYHLRLPRRKTNDGNSLPKMFVQPVFLKTRVNCTTEELASLNLRQEQAVAEVLKRTEVQLFTLRDSVKEALYGLYEMGDALATIDVLQALACVSGQENFVCPRLFKPNEGHTLDIRKGRDFILEHALGEAALFKTNDITFTPDCNLAIVCGPNCSGKSSLLKQTALITIIAHMGCFVPASKADVPLTDRILTRIGTEDNLEASASTFSLEMTETAYILRSEARKDSHQLILIDELGRGTSSTEGFALARAVAEELMTRKNVYTLFVTHYHQLRSLTNLVFAFSLKRDLITNELYVTHQLNDQNDSNEAEEEIQLNYGLYMAESFGFLPEMVQSAFEAKQVLMDQDIRQARQRLLNVLIRDAKIMSIDDIRKSLLEIVKH